MYRKWLICKRKLPPQCAAATNPAIRSYDPAYAYEIAHIMQHGLETMYGENPETSAIDTK